jgi:cyanate permease
MCGPAGYTITIDLGGKHVATVFSLMNMAGNIGAALLPLAVVELVDRHGWPPVLLFLAGIYLAAALCWIVLRVEGSLFE